ncbi:tyrosine recombinase [Tenuifilaceae bacterium CYCD]|nr:tyrosine recombinase [Tenuifilaceae bacterium CYCD]
MSLKINFYLESRGGNEKNLPINMLVWFDWYDGIGLSKTGKKIQPRLKYYTGYRIDSAKWDKEKQEVKKNNVDENGLTSSRINGELATFKKYASDIYQRYAALEKTLTIQLFRDELKKLDTSKKTNVVKTDDNSINRYFEDYKKLVEQKISVGRMKQMKVTFKHFNDFLGKSENLNSITKETIEKFESYLLVNKGKNTVISNLKRLRAFFKYAEDKEWLTVPNPFKRFKIDMEVYGEPIPITKDELEIIYSKDLSSDPKLDRVRDLFIFQCCIGCRVSDLLRLTKDNIVDNTVRYIPIKTKKENSNVCVIPLNQKAQTILKKYENTDKLLPFISDVNFNVYLKELFVACELNRTILRLNPNTNKEEVVELKKIASSHIARKTFISILYPFVKDEVIKSMTGHSPKRDPFGRYHPITLEQKIEAVNHI